jgi:phosphoglycerate-specific signal transduction histidine kinase
MDQTDGPPPAEILHLTSLAEVFGGFAHEIAQPLNAIMIASQVLQLKVERSDLSTPEKNFLVQRLATVTNQVQRASDIVEALRGFTRRSADRAGTHVADIFRRVFGLMEQQFIIRSIAVDVDLAEDLPPVIGEVDTIQEIMVQGLAFSREAVSAIANWHNTHGVPYDKRLQVYFTQTQPEQAMHLDWDLGQFPKGSTVLDPCTHLGLSTAGSVLRGRGGSLLARDDGLTLAFPKLNAT